MRILDPIIFNPLREFLNILLSFRIEKKISMADVAEIFSESVDKIILKHESEGKKFIGGNFYISMLNDTTVKPHLKIYFEEPGKEKCLIIKHEVDDLAMSSLDFEFARELQEKKTIIFEITAP